jgi:membrane protein DedA with SNARE-associated domain
MLDAITAWFGALDPAWLYVALFVAAYVENIVPPVPGDTVVVFAAWLVGRTNHDLGAVLLATTAGSEAGFMTFYAFGRLIDPDYFVRRNFRLLPAQSFLQARRWFERWGYWVVLLNRFLSGVRSVISIVCGMYRLSWVRVLALSTVGCLVWNALLVGAGFMLGSNWKSIEGIFRRYNQILLAAAGLTLVAWWLRARHRKKQRSATGD